MSYVKTQWQDGDIITAEKMNKIEQGIYDATKQYLHNIEVHTGSSSVIVLQIIDFTSTPYTPNTVPQDIVMLSLEGEVMDGQSLVYPSAMSFHGDEFIYRMGPNKRQVSFSDFSDTVIEL